MPERTVTDIQAILRMRQTLSEFKLSLCAVVDAYDAELEAMLPPRDDRRERRMRRYTSDDWGDFLEG